MPDLKWNSTVWGGEYDWKMRGEEWSAWWGGSEAQWFSSLYPRLHRFLPTNAILEIAPGFGRWTKFLLPACNEYIGIDLSTKCIASCRESFSSVEHARFFENDGISLEMAKDGHFGLIFSFDSLVHAEADVLANYIPQILRKLSLTGVAFLHHSNLAALPIGSKNEHSRGASVSAEIVANLIVESGGKPLVQEIINWGDRLVDCLTLFARLDHPYTPEMIKVQNERFMDEASLIRDIHARYSYLGRAVNP